MSIILESIYEAVIQGEDEDISKYVKEALTANIDPQTIFNRALIPAMTEVGRRMELEEYYIPEVLMSAQAMGVATSIIKPLLVQYIEIQSLGNVVIGTVEGDIHDIGKNLVKIMLEGIGFKVEDIGIDIPAAKFVEKVKEIKPDILAMSALLTPTMEKMKEVIDHLNQARLRNDLIILIGGAPVTEEFAIRIGADGTAPDAGGAARLAKELILKRVKGKDLS